MHLCQISSRSFRVCFFLCSDSANLEYRYTLTDLMGLHLYMLFSLPSPVHRHGSRIDSPRALSPWHYQGYSEYDRMLADLRRSLRERRLFSLADPRRRNLCSRLRCSQLQKKPGKRSIHLRSQLCCHLRAAEGSSSLRVLNSNCVSYRFDSRQSRMT